MYFDDLKIGMTVDTEPAVIKKEKMIEFARDYSVDDIGNPRKRYE